MMEYGGGSCGTSGGDNRRRRKGRYHRHTPHQIQRLEGTFNECPHPDEKTRMQLSRELGLSPRQIKFWFQNRRTQMKAQHERADNSVLRIENDRIRCENIAISVALKNVICPSCGGPPVGEDSYFDEQKLRIENAQLKEELDRVASMAAKYIGKPISPLQSMQPGHLHSLDLSMASFRDQGLLAGPSLDLFPGSSSTIPNISFQSMSISDMDKSLMASIASDAMDELIRLLQSSEPLWMKLTPDGREVLNLESYESIFPGASSHLKNPNIRVETSKDSGAVIISGLALVAMFMDSSKWLDIFPTIVSKARTIEVLSSGLMGSKSGSLQLMYGELQVLSPLVPTRHFYFLRFCHQIDQSSWAIVDVSYDLPQEKHINSESRTHRLPSGCLIQDMPNGYSKVTWVEHMEIDDKVPIHSLYRDHIYNGLAFGAERWISTLQRSCDRLACLMVTSTSTNDFGGVIPSPEGKRSVMKLAQRMVNNFCCSINPPNAQQWTTFSGTNEFEVRASLYKCLDLGQPNGGMVLSAATTIGLPISPHSVFSFFKDERTRPQWDVLADHNPVQEIAHIAIGSHPGNCISVLRSANASQNNTLILQESCIDSSGSLVVYCPVDLHAINTVMNGEDLSSYIPLLSSGFAIAPDGRPADIKASTSTTGGEQSAGSLVTVVIQILVSNLPSATLSPESLSTVTNLISNTVQQIKAAFNCSTSS